jgi:hypothetical protein
MQINAYRVQVIFSTLHRSVHKLRAMSHINVHKNTGNLVLNSLIFKINLIVVSFHVTVSDKCVKLPSDLPPILYIYIQGVTGGTDQTSGGCSLC